MVSRDTACNDAASEGRRFLSLKQSSCEFRSIPAGDGEHKTRGDLSMRLLISALAAAGIIGFSFGAYAADEPYTAQPKVTKPGRAIDDGAGTAPNKPKAAGRAIDDGTVTTGKPKKFGREIDDGTVKAPNKDKAAGRAIDDGS